MPFTKKSQLKTLIFVLPWLLVLIQCTAPIDESTEHSTVGGAVHTLAATGTVEAERTVTLEPDCSDQSDTTQSELNECFHQKALRSAQQLADLKLVLESILPIEQWRQLKANQVQWEILRESDCRWAESFYEGGSMAPMQYWSCVNTYNEQRVEFLRAVGCQDGCPDMP
jgi:uncharacterized protein YecT (DUF1311 family)